MYKLLKTLYLHSNKTEGKRQAEETEVMKKVECKHIRIEQSISPSAQTGISAGL